METLQFTPSEGDSKLACEFTVNGNYNLHLEFDTQSDVRDTRIFISQRGSESHKWATAYAGNQGPVFDMDFGHTIFPKLIRVEVMDEPSLAELRREE